jgi:hypothetical protein
VKAPSRRTSARLVFAALAMLYVVLGLFVLTSDAIYSGDIGVKFVQARALAAHRFTSLDLPYPGAFLDPERTFFALRPPFVITAGRQTQAIFPPASSIVQAAAVSIAGVRGMMAVTILAGLLTLWATARMSAPDVRPWALLAVGLAGPLWFFAVSGWEHAQAVAFAAVAFAAAMQPPGARTATIAGAMLGLGVTQRDEVLLLAPGLLAVLWVQARSWRPLAMAAAAAAAVILASTAVDVWWFGRPPAAHLRHAVHIVRGAWLGSEPGTDVPSLQPFTMRQRYETVVWYWLLGHGSDRIAALVAIGFAAALAVRLIWKTPAGLLVWLAAIVTLAAIDLVELLRAPKWLAGMLRVSPYFVFAMLPPPRGGRWTPTHAALVFTAAVYIALAFAGVDTTGGKGLGPRLLLPLFPMLAVASVSAIRDYLSAPSRLERIIGMTGAALLGMSLVVHAAGTIPAYIARNRDDGSAMMTVKMSPERVVVADDMFTAQLLMPLYFSKVLYLAEVQPVAGDLAGRLDRARMGSVLLVSREEPRVTLAPLRLGEVERRGRFVIQHWTR